MEDNQFPNPTDGLGGALEVPEGTAFTEGEDDEATLAQRLAPDTKLHADTVSWLKRYLDLSFRNIEKRFPDWDRVNEHLTMYTNLDSPARKGNKKVDSTTKEMPFQRSVTIPASYAIYKIILTELFSIFASRIPFLRISGRAPEDEQSSPNLEGLLDYDHMQSSGSVAIYSMCADIVRYGQGAIFDHWEEKTKMTEDPSPISQLAVALGIVSAEAMMKPQPIKEYNSIAPVDPYTWWRDPRVSISNLQDGDFCGHRAYKSWNWVKMREMARQLGPYFNVDDLKKHSTSRQGTRETDIVTRTRFADDQFALKETTDDKDKGYYAFDHFQVRLIPKDRKFGLGEDPEIWWITMADEKTIVRCHKSPFEHDQFSYSGAEFDADPHAMFTPGLIESMDGSQRLINWFVNSHVENTRKTINNELIWSPRFFEASTFLNTGPARWIQMTDELADKIANGGRNIGEFYQQLQIADVTTGHLKLVEFFLEMMNRMAGATDPMAGVPTQEQKTLGEINLLTQGASKRNATLAEMIDITAITPLAYRLISNRQQFTSIQQYVKILGSDASETDPTTGQPTLKPISRDDIQGNFDYVPHSAIGPGDPRRAAMTWMNIIQSYGAYPILAQPDERGRIPDVPRMFKEAVRNMGVRDLDTFYKLPPPPMLPPGYQVAPDDQAVAAAQAGNAVPIDETGYGQGGVPA